MFCLCSALPLHDFTTTKEIIIMHILANNKKMEFNRRFVFYILPPSLQSQSKAWIYPNELGAPRAALHTDVTLVLTQVGRSSRSSRSIYGHRQTRSCRGQGQPAWSQIWSPSPGSHSPAPTGTRPAQPRTHGHPAALGAPGAAGSVGTALP